jgi:ribonuclease G
MQSAFVDIGLDSDAFLYVSDFLEHLEDYDHVAPVEHKFQKPPQPVGEVFAPSTTNAGVAHEPVDDAGAAFTAQDASGEGSEPHLDSAFAPNASNESGAPSAESAAPGISNAAVPPAPPMQRTQRPFEQRPDRGRGGFNDRGGRGGRNRSWGRQGGGRGRQQGRDLPPSKYASPKPFDSRPRESQPYEPPPADYQPIILPGESLAKYKDRIPAAPAPVAPPVDSAAGTQAPATESQTSTDFVRDSVRDESSSENQSGLPSSLYASPSVRESVMDKRDEPIAASLPSEAFLSAAPVAYPQEVSEPEIADHELEHESESESETEVAETSDIATHSGPALSEDEVSALAEQLAEAKHEEAQAEVDELPNIEEKGAEPFVEAAELEDLQDALHDDHVADAEEAEEVADAMHDEALAADSATEHAEEHAESGSTKSEGSASAGEWNSQETQETQHDAMGAPPPSFETQPTSARISDQPRARFQRPMRRGGNRQRGGGPRRGGRPNEHRPQQHSHQGQRHEQHRRPLLISEMLKAGEEIIVQIAKEPLGKKGARITSHVALPGRYLVYMPTVDHIGVSRRIGSAEDRSRLRRVVTEAKGTFPGGFIVRTAAADASDDEIRTDVEFLGRTWDTIRATSEQRRAPSLLHRDLNLVERILRDYLSEDYVAIWLDNEEAFTKVVEFVGRFQPKMVPRVKLYTKEAPIFEEFGIQQELDKALRPKVWLKSGGYIVINHTEALVAIDVNTGKYVGRGSTRLEDTIVKTNLEAVKEIVRQIRLRDLGGIIVVDFIDMEERRNREKVMAALDQALNQDRAPSKALSFNEFGLVCITRKRTKQALERVLCQPCPYCTGSGMVKSIPTICYEIQTEARKMSADMDARSLTLRVNPEIAKALKTRESSLIEELEQATRKSVIIQSDPTLHWEQYDIY